MATPIPLRCISSTVASASKTPPAISTTPYRRPGFKWVLPMIAPEATPPARKAATAATINVNASPPPEKISALNCETAPVTWLAGTTVKESTQTLMKPAIAARPEPPNRNQGLLRKNARLDPRSRILGIRYYEIYEYTCSGKYTVITIKH